jgi:hypothetical protein
MLQTAGLIQQGRGSVTVSGRAGLEEAVCKSTAGIDGPMCVCCQAITCHEAHRDSSFWNQPGVLQQLVRSRSLSHAPVELDDHATRSINSSSWWVLDDGESASSQKSRMTRRTPRFYMLSPFRAIFIIYGADTTTNRGYHVNWQRKGPAREPEFKGGPMNSQPIVKYHPGTWAEQVTKSFSLLRDNYPVT